MSLTLNMDTTVLFCDSSADIKDFLDQFPEHIDTIVNDRTPLMHALRNLRYDVFDLLIDRGSNVNTQNSQGETVLHLACEMSYLDQRVVERLIGFRASGLIFDKNGFTPLHRAAMHMSNENVINLLIPISDPNAFIPAGLNSLMLACSYNRNPLVISSLIDVTYDINIQDSLGWTALSNACSSQRYETIKLLLNAGANHKFTNGNNPFDLLRPDLKRKIKDEMFS